MSAPTRGKERREGVSEVGGTHSLTALAWPCPFGRQGGGRRDPTGRPGTDAIDVMGHVVDWWIGPRPGWGPGWADPNRSGL
jgi:hypothetical protein